jgi:glycine cleavage system transcriptional repressor
MSRLGGYFAMLMVVVSEQSLDVDVFACDFVRSTSGLRLDVSVEALPDEMGDDKVDGDAWALTLTGTDRPGVVSSVSYYLAEIGANIDELSTRIVGMSSAEYTVLIDMTVPRSVDCDAMLDRLHAIAGDVGASCDARLL